MLNEVRYALRVLLRKPGFFTLVVLTLALGIGANVALFSVVNAVLLNPLPFPEPDQLVTFHQSKPNFETGAIPYPNFIDLQRENQTFAAMAISRGASFSLLGAGEAERVNGRFISADYFSLLGVTPALGRTFSADDDAGRNQPVVLISQNLWDHKFNSATDVIGRSIRLDDGNYNIVGVIPRSFDLSPDTDVYLDIGQWNNPALKSRGAALGLHGTGRLKAGVTVDQAQADLNRVMQHLASLYPETNRGNGAKIISLKDSLIGNVRLFLLVLLAAVGFVLLIACANVSNLMLARSNSRTHEFAIRAALGAGQTRLLRQVLLESVITALIAGSLGLLIAAWATKLVVALLPAAMPRANEIRLDWRVLAFALCVSLLSALLSGMIPAIKTARDRSAGALREGRSIGGGRSRTQGVMVAAEVALALVLLIGAGLMIRSLSALWKVDPGFRADDALTFEVDMPSMQGAKAQTVRSNVRDLSERLSAIPGVTAASLFLGAAPLLGENDGFFWIEGRPKPASQSEMPMALFYVVEPGYLDALRIPLKKGRFFSAEEDQRAAPVVVIDDVLARQYFGDRDPLGERINLGDDQGPREIIGVVGHVKQWGLEADSTQSLRAQLYMSFRGLPDRNVEGLSTVGVVLRGGDMASNDGKMFLNSIRQTIRSQHSDNILADPLTMDEAISRSLGQKNFSMVLLIVFASVALCLATLGIYGVVSYLVGQRTKELGIRIALGATRTSIIRLVLGHGLKMILAGVFVGTLAALALTRLMVGMLYGVQPSDPATFTVIAGLLVFVALIACYVPARRATRVDPLAALKHE